MKEIEVKILNISPKDIRLKLKRLGAKKIFEGELSIAHFDHADRRIKKNDQLLRVRTVGKVTELCFKGAREKSAYKVQEETQVQTDSFPKTVAILQKLGFEEVRHWRKHRESWKLGKVSFEIDSWEGVPSFLEIEAPDEKAVEKYVKKLGFTMKQTTNMVGREVEKHYQRLKKVIK